MPLKIAYLDDEPELCETFVDNFANDCVEIRTFTDPESFLASLVTYQPDMVFLDYRLPNCNGDLIASRIRGEIPKILITGDFTVTPQTKFHRILQKPYNFAEVEALIQKQIEEQIKNLT